MSNNLKVYRIKSGLTQSELANLIGVSFQTYNAWESNPGIVKIRYANQLADLFNVSLDAIFRT